nr:sterol desaturase family protein [Pseudenhygromyxa sp. WMMC2535]
MVGVDLLFYWWHRSSHVVNVLWAVHGVHHQSEDYNLAVALRQPAFEPITWLFFYIPLAFLGVSPEIYIASYAVDRLYQFFIHTQLVDKLPRPLEWILNTPSHHRVHHGVQDQYLDKNYGAILIIWDRIFGTFEPEGERVVYGTTVPLDSYNPVWGNLQYFAHMAALARQAKTWRDKAWVWVAHPAWLPAGVERDPNEKKRMAAPERKYQPAITKPLAWYIAGHYALLGGLMVAFLLLEHELDILRLSAGAAVIIAASMTFLGLIERKPWAMTFERLRGPMTALVAALIAWPWLPWWGVAGLSLALLAVIVVSQRLFAPALTGAGTGAGAGTAPTASA